MSVFRATGRPSSCSFEGRHAPRSSYTRTNDGPPSPQQLPDAVQGPKQRGEHQPSNLCVEGRAEPPTEPRVDTEIRRPTRTAERSPGMSWSQLNAGATIPHEHATGCNSMQIPSSKQDTSWAPLGCSGETCSLSEETKSRTATASRASCHETRTTGESLPHFHRCVSSWGALLSSAVYELLPSPPFLPLDSSTDTQRGQPS